MTSTKKKVIKPVLPKKISSTEEEKFMALMRNIDDRSLNNMSEAHITEFLGQRRKIGEYIHEENMQQHERFKIVQKNSLYYFGGSLAFVTIVLIIVAVIDKTLILEVFKYLVVFLGGIGIGKIKIPNADNQDK